MCQVLIRCKGYRHEMYHPCIPGAYVLLGIQTHRDRNRGQVVGGRWRWAKGRDGDRNRLCLGRWTHDQCADDVLLSCALETCTPIHSMKKCLSSYVCQAL